MSVAAAAGTAAAAARRRRRFRQADRANQGVQQRAVGVPHSNHRRAVRRHRPAAAGAQLRERRIKGCQRAACAADVVKRDGVGRTDGRVARVCQPAEEQRVLWRGVGGVGEGRVAAAAAARAGQGPSSRAPAANQSNQPGNQAVLTTRCGVAATKAPPRKCRTARGRTRSGTNATQPQSSCGSGRWGGAGHGRRRWRHRPGARSVHAKQAGRHRAAGRRALTGSCCAARTARCAARPCTEWRRAAAVGSGGLCAHTADAIEFQSDCGRRIKSWLAGWLAGQARRWWPVQPRTVSHWRSIYEERRECPATVHHQASVQAAALAASAAPAAARLSLHPRTHTRRCRALQWSGATCSSGHLCPCGRPTGGIETSNMFWRLEVPQAAGRTRLSGTPLERSWAVHR